MNLSHVEVDAVEESRIGTLRVGELLELDDGIIETMIIEIKDVLKQYPDGNPLELILDYLTSSTHPESSYSHLPVSDKLKILKLLGEISAYDAKLYRIIYSEDGKGNAYSEGELKAMGN